MVIKPPPPTDSRKQQSIVNFGRKTKYTSRPFTKIVDEGEDTPTVKEEDTPTVKEEGTPTVKEEDTPTVKEEDTPIVKEEDTPIVKEEDTPTVKEEDTPTVKEEGNDEETSRPRRNVTTEHVKTEPDTLSVTPIVVTPEIKQVKLSPPSLVEKKTRRKKKKIPVKEEKESAQKLTDFYQVRRSSRQPPSKIKDQEYQSLVDKVKRKCTDGLEVRDIVEKGRGVFSKKDFVRKEFVVEYSGKLITYEEAKEKEIEYSQHPEYGCYMYYFQFKNKKYCIDGTAEDGSLGRLLNHSINGNVESKVVNIEDRPVLLLVAKTDIPADTELVYDYGERNTDVIKSYPWLKN